MRITDEAAVAAGCWWDEEAASRPGRFFERHLRHSKGRFAGEPFVPLPWQLDDVLRPFYGWRRPDGRRRYDRCGIWVPKKNGKSTLLAGIGIFHLVADHEEGPEVYVAAADRDQASIIYAEAVNMAEANPALIARLDPVRSKKVLAFPARRGFMKALSADVPTKEGINWSALLFDELHAQPNRKLWDTLRWGGAMRTQPALFSISTAGYDRTSLGWEQYDYARRVRDGVVQDDGFLPVIYEAGEEDDWADEAVWARANPSMPDVITLESFRAAFREARDNPRLENAFRRYRLNQWTQQDVRWLPMHKWDACSAALPELKGKACYGGLDMASVADLAAMALWFPEARAALVFFWTPEANISARERAGRTRIDGWVRSGHIIATPGNTIDYARIRVFIQALGQEYDIRKIGVDRWNTTQLQMELADDGFDVEGWGQGYASMTAPTKELERMVMDESFVHGGHPVLRWNADTVVVETSASGDIKPSKRRSLEKIDGIVALIMGLGEWMKWREPSQPSLVVL